MSPLQKYNVAGREAVERPEGSRNGKVRPRRIPTLTGVGTTNRLLVIAVLAIGTACARAPRWTVQERPTPELAAILLDGGSDHALDRVPDPSLIPQVPIPERLRPCCAFGTDLRVKVGAVPVPGFRIGNLMGLDEIGPHTYDSGAFTRSSYRGRLGKSRTESNGLIYSCRGGFIDSAHVRDYADWTVYLAAEIARNAYTGVTIVLPDEGGERRIIIQPIDEGLIDRYGLNRVVTQLAHWLGFQLSIWHEIATWYGWSWVKTFPETASAFSPEDLYSNILGVRIGYALIRRSVADTEHVYNESFNAWFEMAMRHLVPVPRDVGVDAMKAVDQHWWDSSRRLPEKELTLRRHLGIGSKVEPWLVPASKAPDSLRALCGDDPQPVAIRNPASVGGFQFRNWGTLLVDVDDGLAVQFPFSQLGRRISQEDFPAIVKAIRKQNREAAGEHADQPD